jgi:hypothetical protein
MLRKKSVEKFVMLDADDRASQIRWEIFQRLQTVVVRNLRGIAKVI